MKKPRDHQGGQILPSDRKARVSEEPIQKSRKKERSLSSITSPRLSFLSRHSDFSWYEEDLWIEVAKYLDGKDLIRLAMTNKWFYRLIMEDGIWKHACLRDLQVHPPNHVSFKWFQLYASAFDWMRIGAFFFETPLAVLTEKLELPTKLTELEEDQNMAIQLSGTCILTDIRTGIWIAGTMQILDVRHFELFLEESFRNGCWQFEDIGSHRIERQSKSAAGGVFDYKHIYSPCTAGLFDTSGWFAEPGDWQPRARLSPHAVAVNTNLQPNDGIHVRFQAMRSKGSDGKVVSIRISQQLI